MVGVKKVPADRMTFFRQYILEYSSKLHLFLDLDGITNVVLHVHNAFGGLMTSLLLKVDLADS